MEEELRRIREAIERVLPPVLRGEVAPASSGYLLRQLAVEGVDPLVLDARLRLRGR